MTNTAATNREELKQIVLATRLYYEEGRTQQEIANVMQLSRPTVSRLLARAREEHILTITIADPFQVNASLANQLCQATGLQKAVISPIAGAGGGPALTMLGISAARHLETNLQPGAVVGVGWGRSLHALVQSFTQPNTGGQTFVPLLGGLGQVAPSFQVNELIRSLAEKCDADCRQLYLPAVIEDEDIRQRLLATPDARWVMDEWANMSMAVVGIGGADFEPEVKSLFGQYLDGPAQERLRLAQAVGDICMRFFDRDGQPIPDGLRGVISIELEQLRSIPEVIGVAAGPAKVDAILSAIRGGFIKTLVTDDGTAQAMLSKLTKESSGDR